MANLRIFLLSLLVLHLGIGSVSWAADPEPSGQGPSSSQNPPAPSPAPKGRWFSKRCLLSVAMAGGLAATGAYVVVPNVQEWMAERTDARREVDALNVMEQPMPQEELALERTMERVAPLVRRELTGISGPVPSFFRYMMLSTDERPVRPPEAVISDIWFFLTTVESRDGSIGELLKTPEVEALARQLEFKVELLEDEKEFETFYVRSPEASRENLKLLIDKLLARALFQEWLFYRKNYIPPGLIDSDDPAYQFRVRDFIEMQLKILARRHAR